MNLAPMTAMRPSKKLPIFLRTVFLNMKIAFLQLPKRIGAVNDLWKNFDFIHSE